MDLTPQQMRKLKRIQRKYKVSMQFLKYNVRNIWKFMSYALSPRLIIKRVAQRKGKNQRIVLDYYHLRRLVFDHMDRKFIKTRKRNVQQWSRRMVCHLRNKYGVKEHVEEMLYIQRDQHENVANEGSVVAENVEVHKASGSSGMAPKEVCKQLKEQLELLRSGKRTVPLMEVVSAEVTCDASEQVAASGVDNEKESETDASEPAAPTTTTTTDNTEDTNAKTSESACSAELAAELVGSKGETVTSVENCLSSSPTVIQKTASIQSKLETTPEKQIMVGRSENFLDTSQIPKSKLKRLDSSSIVNVAHPNVDCVTNGTGDSELESELKELQEPKAKKLRMYAPAVVEQKNTKVQTPVATKTFLDMLMNKMGVKGTNSESAAQCNAITTAEPNTTGQKPLSPCNKSHDNEHFTDSSEEFFGFDETERKPGMMLTPLVPYGAKSKGSTNAAFISESLNEYMRENSLETSNAGDAIDGLVTRRHRQANLDGLVTPGCTSPYMDMPLVPESLQKLRTVAERRQYLQKFNKNHKLAIINNEATIYRELQRKTRLQKSKSVSQQLLQAPNAQMPFTRQGWQAASFVATEFNKYYYQTLLIEDSNEYVRLPGVRGNNEERSKRPYHSRVLAPQRCSDSCCDLLTWRDLKPIKTFASKKKLNKAPFPSVFKACPLSHKPFQKPLDDETAALLLAGGSMAVVRMPTIELEVFPSIGKPLHEVAKRYLQYILPHHDISREWAEFSVSTLQQPRTMKETEKAVATTCTPERRKSFTFAIPYLNDRNHILVRRVVDRSEKLDQSFEMAKECDSDAVMTEDLSFRANLDTSDKVLLDCANVVTDMINCVAISCSENSFIKEDPDGLYCEEKPKIQIDKMTPKDEKHVGGDVEQEKVPLASAAVAQLAANKKQNRLLSELRRLNATIIDAAVKAEKGSKPCVKEYCAMGCVCTSLTDDYPLRQHCGKSKCVIECSCKGSNQPRIMRLETDGRSITTEDAFMLRRKATARLARMEKEFTSTVVLTENETLLINESQYDKKRRCTKAPKRYEDFADTDDDPLRTSVSPKKPTPSGAMVTIEATESLSSSTGYSEVTTELREPIFVKDTTLEQLKHCSVPLVQFEDTKNMVVWCMVHELYKCYCGGRAVEGKPLLIEKEGPNMTTPLSKSGEEEYVLVPSKARYCFEKTEEHTRVSAADKDDEHEEDEKEQKSIEAQSSKPTEKLKSVEYISDDDDASDEDDGISNSDSDFEADKIRAKRLKRGHQIKRGRPTEAHLRNDYFNMKPNFCRRAVPVPAKSYLRTNRKRQNEVREFIKKHENKQTMLLLNEHILRSVYFHKNEIEKQRKAEFLQQKPSDITEKQQVTLASSVVDLTDEDSRHSSVASSTSLNHGTRSSAKRMRSLQLQEQWTEHVKCDKKAAMEHSHRTEEVDLTTQTAESPPVVEIVDRQSNVGQEQAQEQKQQQEQDSFSGDVKPVECTQTPHLYKTFSLNDALNDEVGNASSSTAATLAVLNMLRARAGGEKTATEFNRDFNNAVIRYMNQKVSRKMQDIDLALKRKSSVIPAPNNEILCIMKWTNFLDAFVEGFVFIWEVKMPDYSFFAATITNMMPLVEGAMGVVNLAALKPVQLPLMGRMLLQRCRSERTCDLAVLMQGRAKYWLVKGFLRPDRASVCQKPTPQTHPSLTQKINVLYNLLLKQRVTEIQSKLPMLKRMHMQGIERKTVEKTESRLSGAMSAEAKEEAPYPEPKEAKEKNKLRIAAFAHKPSTTTQQPAQRTSTFLHNRTAASYSNKSRVKPSKSITSSKVQTGAKSTMPATSKKISNPNADLLRELNNQDGCVHLKSNLEFCKVTKEDIEEIHEPEVYAEDHRWLVLNLCNDFSHIFLPEFRDLVSLDRIHKVMALSRQKQKIVKLLFFKDAPFDAFVTPSSARKIYFGPLKVNAPTPVLILLQSVDGRMMLREIYQQEHNIVSKPLERTTAFWIGRINGQTHFDFDAEQNNVTAESLKEQPEVNAEEDSDDDCMIVDDEKQTASQSSIPVASSRNITNFTIQTNVNTNQLQITQVLGGATQQQLQIPPAAEQLSSTPFVPIRLPLSTPMLQLPLTAAPVLNLPQNAVITSVAAAPKEAPYGATIYISNMPAGTATINTTQLSQPQPQPLAEQNNIIASKTTFLTPDVCVTATADSDMTAINDALIKRQALSNSSKRPRSQCSTGGNKPSKNTTAVRVSVKDVLQESSMQMQETATQSVSSLPQENPAKPTYITPDVQVTAGNNNTACTGQFMSLKRRRYSFFYNSKGEVEVANQRLSLDNEGNSKNLSSDGKPSADEEFPGNTAETTAPSNSSGSYVPTQSVSTIGCITITKVGNEAVQHKMQLDLEQSKQGAAMSPRQPIVMPLKFAGDPDEPEASIVFKRPNVDAEKVEMALNNAAKKVRVGNTYYKRTATGLIKAAATANPSKVSATANAVNVDATANTSKLPTMRSTTSVDKMPTPTTKLPTLPILKTLATSNSSTNASTTTLKTSVANSVSTKAAINKVETAGNRSFGVNSNTRPSLAVKTTTVKPVQNRSSLPVISTVTSLSAAATTATPPSAIFKVKAAVPIPQRNNIRHNQSQQQIRTTAESSTAMRRASVANVSPRKLQPKVATGVPTISTAATATTTSTSTVTVPVGSKTQLGIFISPVYSAPRFVSKNVNGVYWINVPGVGTVELNGLTAVNNYLNRHMLKLSKSWHQKMHTVWKFVPQRQLQSKKPQQLVDPLRQTPSPTLPKSSSTKIVIKASKPTATTTASNTSKVVANAVAAASPNVLSDPILIED